MDILEEFGIKTSSTKTAEQIALEEAAKQAEIAAATAASESAKTAEAEAARLATEEAAKKSAENIQSEEQKKVIDNNNQTPINFGEILGIDELKDKDAEFIKNYVHALRQGEQNHKSELEKLTNLQSPFDSEQEAKVFYFKKATKLPYDIAEKFTQSNLKELPAIDVLVMNEMLKNPDKAKKTDFIRTMIEEDYNIKPELSDTDKENMNDSEIADYNKKRNFAIEKMEYRSDLVRSELEEKINKIEVPKKLNIEDKQKAQAEAFAKVENAWTEVSSKILPDDMPPFPIHMNGEDGNPLKVSEVKVPASELAEIRKAVSKSMTQSGILPDKEGQQQFVEMVYNTYIANNFTKLVTEAIEAKEKEWKEKTSNAGLGTKVTSTQKITKKQEFDNKINDLLNS